MRMDPIHVTRKFWWELIFISVLVFLLVGVRSQTKREVLAAAQAVLVPVIELGVVAAPPLKPLALN
jgi:hypothetical protein